MKQGLWGKLGVVLALVPVFGAAATAAPAPTGGPAFTVSFGADLSKTPLQGRLLLLLSTDASAEPRLQIGHEPSTQMVFGHNVEGMAPGGKVLIDAANTVAWPVDSLKAVPPGDYIVQAVLNRYETFHRADGSVINLAPDRGEGQQWSKKPGNLVSAPMKIHLTADMLAGGASSPIEVRLDHALPEITPPKDTAFVRHIRIKSTLLSAFWGTPVYLGANILLPAGFDAHPEAHYPLMVFHGHFPEDISEFRTTPPDPDLKPITSERFHLEGYNRIEQEEAYKSYQRWISKDFPRFLVVEIQHANPYYDDSYAVNSANLGPYGDAINKELIPAIEARFRGLGAGWARFTYGGSTGGWEAMATQVFYPDMYNGAFAACPDPIDFRAYTLINLYKDPNAFVLEGAHESLERPAVRNYLGEIMATQRGTNQYERALGDRGRSGEQYDIWQAVYGPEGEDGYPKPIFDKVTGAIDPNVALFWRDHYDLSYILARDWKTLGPKLKGKLHIYVGSEDTYYLNDAVYFAEDRLKALKDPEADVEVAYGPRAEHCWNGDPNLPNAYSRLHYNVQYLPKILERIKETAPKGADLTSWRY
jgi:hypothetical protein